MKIHKTINNSAASYEGIFNDVVTDVNSIEKTNPQPAMFGLEKKSMNNDKLIEGFRLLLSGMSSDEIITFAQTAGIPIEQIQAILAGATDVTEKTAQQSGCANEFTPSKGIHIHIGSRSETVYSGNNCTHFHYNNDCNTALMELIINELKKVVALHKTKQPERED